MPSFQGMKDTRTEESEFDLSDRLIRNRSVSELRAIVRGLGAFLTPEALSLLEKDSRAGVRALAAGIRRKAAASIREEARLKALCRFESDLWERGVARIAGLDEAGVGPLAGPVVAAAVIFPPGLTIPGVDDSKKIPPEKRECLAGLIKEQAVAWAIAEASPCEIDQLNIYQASLLAMRRAVERLAPPPGHLLVDARTINGIGIPQTAIVKGDTKSFTIAAASILAKTWRDGLMLGLDRRYPGYGFNKNKGYPTAFHREALARLGPTPEHRRSFTLRG